MNIFSVNQLDLEHFYTDHTRGKISQLKHDLLKIDTKHHYTFVHKDKSTLLYSNNERPELFSLEFDDPKKIDIEQIYGSEDIYSIPFIKGDYFKINGSYFRFFRVLQFPDEMDILSLQNVAPYLVQFKRINPSFGKSILNVKRNANAPNINDELRNFKGEESFSQIEALLEQVELGNEELVKVEAWFFVKADTEKELSDLSKQLKEHLNRVGFEFLIESVGLKYAIDCFLPKSEPSFINASTRYVSQLINMLPLTKSFLYKEGADFYSSDMEKIHLDIFNSKNLYFNALFVGPPGSGKSFAVGYIVESLINHRKAKALIVDKGGSYSRLCRYYDGHEFGEKFNPMNIKDPNFLYHFILASIPADQLSAVEKGKLFEELSGFNLSSINHFKELVEKVKSVSNFKYYFSDIIEYFNDEIQESSDFYYIDIDNYNERILPCLLVYLIELFKGLEGYKVLTLDEVHYLLDRVPEFVEDRFRTMRKFMGACFASTQSLSSYLNSKVGRVIIDCSYFKFLFNQPIEPNEYINSEDCSYINEIKTIKDLYSEFYLKTDNMKKVLRLIPSPKDLVLLGNSYDTNKSIEEYISKHKGIIPFKKSISNLASIMYE